MDASMTAMKAADPRPTEAIDGRSGIAYEMDRLEAEIEQLGELTRVLHNQLAPVSEALPDHNDTPGEAERGPRSEYASRIRGQQLRVRAVIAFVADICQSLDL